RCVLAFGILTAIMAYIPAQRYEYSIAERDQRMYQAGVLATLLLDFWPKTPSLYWGSSEIYRVWHRPRPPNPSYAEREPFKWIGHSLLHLRATTGATRCLGHVDTIDVLEGDPRVLRLDGWALVAGNGDYLRWVLIGDDNDVGVGAGKPGL